MRQYPEPLDRNKTDLTHKLTALASGYLAYIGCKPIETEVPVAPGWIADVAGFTYPTQTELKNAKLLKRLVVENPQLKGVPDYQLDNIFKMRNYFPLTALCEVKISIADFKKDLERKFQKGAANLNYLVIPQSIKEAVLDIEPHFLFLHLKWGMIVCSDSGEKITKVESPAVVPMTAADTIDFIASVAIKRDHRSRYSYMRAMMKSYRVEQRERKEREKRWDETNPIL